MSFSILRAINLIDKPRDDYQCNHVVNEVLNGDKNRGGLAKSYLNWGKETKTPKAGSVVVSKDGSHVGIFISDKEFIHSSLSRKKVIKAPLSQLPFVFKKGYVIREPADR
jgi:hypothetical protein